MDLIQLEIFLITGIVVLQIFLFGQTLYQILSFKKIITPVRNIKVSKIYITQAELQNHEPAQILANLNEYRYASSPNKVQERVAVLASYDDFGDEEYLDEDLDTDEPDSFYKEEDFDNEEFIELSIIESDSQNSKVFENVLNSINTYLIRNKGAASDFNLIKDIVERNVDAYDEKINLSVSVPLYLGLAGTMLGIVIGLFNMSDLSGALSGTSANEQLGEGIDILLGGVKIAMIASFVGLLLTIINSAFVYKGAKSKVEAKKNDFYTFVQTELLPVINQSFAGTMESLQRNLFKFNSEFSGNLTKLTGLFHSNFEYLELQDRMIQNLEKIDIAKVAKYNVNVLKELKESTQQFVKFNTYLNQVNSMIDSSKQLTSKLNDAIDRTEDFHVIANSLGSKFDQSQQLLDFLSSHFKDLQDRSHLIQTTVADVDNVMTEAVGQLKEHTQAKISSFKEITIREEEVMGDMLSQIREHNEAKMKAMMAITAKEEELMIQAFSENKTNLNKLSYLESVNKNLYEMKMSTASQVGGLKSELADLNSKIAASFTILEEMNKRPSLQNGLYTFFSKVYRKLFNSKKTGKHEE
ncbi:MotA/TolQ/ExbB proton channel family protein [uncultured Pontibacter sp.]|uniref:MotA/TolQ/ExbB proton channel family protein n=1 Tax=uncultured Pontibacter sp. TaxID=453356 RepID=UPI00261B6EF9|nr:MotA/TolQ/ExbB proton channel family protein [uncultured Pontibacter sp.]